MGGEEIKREGREGKFFEVGLGQADGGLRREMTRGKAATEPLVELEGESKGEQITEGSKRPLDSWSACN